MLKAVPCVSSKSRGALGIFFLFLLINGLVLSFYIRRPQSSFMSTFEIVGTKLKTALFATSFKENPPAIVNISILSKELGIPHADWMDEPIVNPFPFGFSHNPYNVCLDRTVDLLVAVPVARANFLERQAVRDTWGSFANYPALKTITLFFVGIGSRKDETPSVQKRIDMESRLYGDIVQAQFLDTYRNLTLKSVSFLRWSDAYCPQADFILKADDDMYILVPKLLDNLKKARKKSKREFFILGCSIVGAVPVQDKTSKWYTPKELFSEAEYPKYASGTSYAMTGKAARVLLQTSLRTPFFWLEDIYVTGLCSRKAGIEVINDWSVTFTKPPASGCQFKKYTTGHRYSVAELRKIHKEILDIDLVCPPIKKVIQKKKTVLS